MSNREALGKLTGEELEGLVHDLKAQEAATINNAGKEAQLEFLSNTERHGPQWVTVYVRGGVAEVDRSSGVRVEVLDFDNDGCDCVPDAHSHEVFEAGQPS